MIKLIVSDMDGTLLNNELEVPQANAEAIKRAQQQGIEFVVATGRNYGGGYPLVQAKDISCPFIGINGAEYYDNAGQLKYSRGLDKTTVRSLMDMLDKTPVYYELVTNNGVYSDNPEQHLEHLKDVLKDINVELTDDMIEKYRESYLEKADIKFISDYNNVVDDENIFILKMTIQSTSGEKKLAQVRKEAENLVDDIAITASSRKNLEINHEEATKGLAVAAYAKSRNIEPEEVMTLGDNLNDISMLKWADYSVAMGNAVPEAKEAAKFSTSTNAENGVAEAISRVLNGDIYEQ